MALPRFVRLFVQGAGASINRKELSNIFSQGGQFLVSTWNTLGGFWKNLLKFLLFLSIGTIIFYLVYQKQQAAYLEDCLGKGQEVHQCSYVQKLVSDFTGANFSWIFLSMFMFMVSNLNRAVRWKMLLKPLGYRPRLVNCYLAIIVGYFANLGFPRMGEMARPAMLAQYEKLNLEKVVGTVVVSRIIDVIMMGLVVGIASLLALDKVWPFIQANLGQGNGQSGLNFLIAATGLLILAGVVLFRYRGANLPLQLRTTTFADHPGVSGWHQVRGAGRETLLVHFS